MKYLSYREKIRWLINKNRGNRYTGQCDVFILGHPRSGTSFVAGLINRMGFSFGPDKWLKQDDQNNPYGYYECKPLMKISQMILRRFGGNFFDLPSMPENWSSKLASEKQDISALMKYGQIQAFKDNHLLILADLYNEIFPYAKWIFVDRPVDQTYRSRFGRSMSFDDWCVLSEQRQQAWEESVPFRKAFSVEYESFKRDNKRVLLAIQNYLEIELTTAQIESCLKFFKPRNG